MEATVAASVAAQEAAGRYKGMSQCATRLVSWSGITEASARRPAPRLWPKNEAPPRAYSCAVSRVATSGQFRAIVDGGNGPGYGENR